MQPCPHRPVLCEWVRGAVRPLHAVETRRQMLQSLKLEGIHYPEDTISSAHVSTFSWIFDKDGAWFIDEASHSSGML